MDAQQIVRQLIERAAGATTRLVQVERREIAAVVWAFAWFFLVLLGHYVLRPVRDTLGIAGGVVNLKWLFLVTFVVMLVAVPLYSLLVARLPRRVLVAAVYRLFAVNLILFWLAMRGDNPILRLWTGRVFFVWMGVFGLFSVSIFWSFLADIFSSPQGGRLFGLVSAGGTLGGLFGSVVAGQCVGLLGMANLLVIPVVLLELALVCARRLDRAARHLGPRPPSDDGGGPRATGGGVMTGITSVLRSRYLLGISGYLFLATFCGTIIYFEQLEIVKAVIPSDVDRTRLFADVNLAVQIISFGVQTFVTAHLVRGLGLPATLCLLPLLCLAGFGALGTAPVLAVLVVVEVARRAAIYAIAEPARVVLFTVVTREQKYKAKSFIDTVVFRAGDTVGAFLFSQLRAIGLGLAPIAWTMLPVALLWGVLGWVLGRQQRHRARQQIAVTPSPETPTRGRRPPP